MHSKAQCIAKALKSPIEFMDELRERRSMRTISKLFVINVSFTSVAFMLIAMAALLSSASIPEDIRNLSALLRPESLTHALTVVFAHTAVYMVCALIVLMLIHPLFFWILGKLFAGKGAFYDMRVLSFIAGTIISAFCIVMASCLSIALFFGGKTIEIGIFFVSIFCSLMLACVLSSVFIGFCRAHKLGKKRSVTSFVLCASLFLFFLYLL